MMPPLSQRNLLADFLVFLFVLSASFFLYRHGIVGIPRGDHIGWIATRSSMSSEWEFFLYSILSGRGDAFLFRPGFGAVTCLIDMMFRHNLYVVGAISIAMHGLVCFALYLLLARLSGRLISLLLTAVFLTQAAGMEMVFWRHISSYLFGAFFFLLGLLAWFRAEAAGKERPKIAPVLILFSLASLFHESFIFPLAVSGTALLVFRWLGGRKIDARFRRFAPWLAVCFIPFAFYAGLNLVATHFTSPDSLFSSLDRAGELGVWAGAVKTTFLAGLFLTVFSLPFFIRISFPELGAKAFGDYSAVPEMWLYVSGFMLLIVLISLFLRSARKYLAKERSPETVVSLVIPAYFLVLTAGVALGRLVLRDPKYLEGATYYYYFANLALILLLALFFNFLRTRIGKRAFVADLAVAVFAFLQMGWNASALEAVLRSRAAPDELVANSSLEIASLIDHDEAYCYGGSLNSWPSPISPNFLLYRFRCPVPGREPLYTDIVSPRDVRLSRLQPVQGKEVVPLQLDNPIAFDLTMEPKSLGKLVRMQGRAFMSLRAYKPSYVGVEVKTPDAVGLIFAFRNPQNYMMLVVDQGYFFLVIIRDGFVSLASRDGRLPSARAPFELSVRNTGSLFVVFQGENAIAVIEGVETLEGALGTCDLRPSPTVPGLSELTASEADQGRVTESVFILKTFR